MFIEKYNKFATEWDDGVGRLHYTARAKHMEKFIKRVINHLEKRKRK